MLKIFRSFSLFTLKVFFEAYFFISGRPKQDRSIEKLIVLYEKGGFTRWFARIRLWDAPFKRLDKIVPKSAKILDLGCGDGIISNYLAISSPSRKLVGMELNEERVRFADRNLQNTEFLKGDVLKSKFSKGFETILMVHLLHHLQSFKDQEKVLKKCFNILKKGGKLIIVEVDIKPTFKYLLSWLADHFVVPILFESKLFEPRIYFRKKKEWVSFLEEMGFFCKAISAEKGKPFTHIIFDCTKT